MSSASNRAFSVGLAMRSADAQFGFELLVDQYFFSKHVYGPSSRPVRFFSHYVKLVLRLVKNCYMSDLSATANYASVWTLADITVMGLISEKRDESPFQISDRALARAIDVSAPRVSDLFNCRHGSPSLREFIALCQFFNLNPASRLEQALQLSRQNEEQKSRAAKLDRVADHPEDFDIAALHDPNAAMER